MGEGAGALEDHVVDVCDCKEAEREAAGVGTAAAVAAADWTARWRMASSEGVGRRSWALDARWLGVCERGTGGARPRVEL